MKADVSDPATGPAASPGGAARAARRAIFIVSPDGQAGGGMGRVKDYILEAGDDAGRRYDLVPLTTRDHRGALASLWLLARAILTIWAAAARGRAALVHANVGDKGSFARKGLVVVLARAVGLPVVLHLHAVTLERHYAHGGALRRWLIRAPFHAATTVVVLGERWRRWLTQELDVRSGKIEILRNGVPMPPCAPRVRASPSRILFLGNLQERKGVSDLIAALAMLPRRDWHATFAGGGDLDHYRALAQGAGLSDRISFAGWVDQPQARALLAASDILVLPSYEEGLPLVILEALGAGTPVVCTPVGSIPEVLVDGDTALFCPPGDRAALAACLDRIMSDEGLWQRLASRGLDLFARSLSLEAFHRSLFAIYRQRCGVAFVLHETTPADTREAV